MVRIIEDYKNLDYKDLDELLMLLFYRLKKRNMSITHTRLQKAIFIIKMKLGKEHTLSKSLPYYWYNHGPFSNYVADSLHDMINDLDYKSPSYRLKDNKFEKFDNESFNITKKYPSVKYIISDLINNDKYFYERLYEDVYKNFGPYKCLHPFKFEIFRKADEDREISPKSVDHLINTFFECESTLPIDNFFIEYNDIFSNLVSMLDTLNDEDRIIDSWTALREPIKKSWYTFAKGLRARNRDEIYNYNQKFWEIEFKDCTKLLSLTIRNLEDFVYNNDSYYVSLNESHQKLLNSTLGNYLYG